MIPTDTIQDIGKKAENLAVSYLEKNACIILERNFTLKFGEIDIIAEYTSNNTILFVEVRARKINNNFYSAIESVDKKKQKKIIKTAFAYLQTKSIINQNCRFDIIALDYLYSIKNAKIKWLKNAFSSYD